MAALPPSNRQNAEMMRQRLHFDMSGWQPYEEATPCLSTLQDALWQDRRLTISYERSDHSQVERLVDPLGLVAKGAVWYLVAAVDGAPRTYRVARVLAAQLSEQPCVRPPDFNLAAFWEQSKSEFMTSRPRYPVTARVAPGMLERMRYAGRYTRLDKIEALGQPDELDWRKVQIGFEFEREAAEYVLSFGDQIEVLEPLELRQKVIILAQGVLDFYHK
jgi:predicted DNA-binding transcriptional regulator YafY